MSRSKWKGPYVNESLLNLKNGSKISLKTWSRCSTIPYSFLGKNVFVYNGKMFKRVLVTREKIGYKFGEFSFTRTYKTKKKVWRKKQTS